MKTLKIREGSFADGFLLLGGLRRYKYLPTDVCSLAWRTVVNFVQIAFMINCVVGVVYVVAISRLGVELQAELGFWEYTLILSGLMTITLTFMCTFMLTCVLLYKYVIKFVVDSVVKITDKYCAKVEYINEDYQEAGL